MMTLGELILQDPENDLSSVKEEIQYRCDKKGAMVLLDGLANELLADETVDDAESRNAVVRRLAEIFLDLRDDHTSELWLQGVRARMLLAIANCVRVEGRLFRGALNMPTKKKRQLCRAALLWDSLKDKTVSSDCCDSFARWQLLPNDVEDLTQQDREAKKVKVPTLKDLYSEADRLAKQISQGFGESLRSLTDVLRLILGIDNYFAERCYSTLFPAVGPSKDVVLKVCVTLLGMERPVPPALPCVVLAPWSIMALTSRTVDGLRDLFQHANVRRELSLEDTTKFMIDLVPTEERPPETEIDGESLSFSIALAAWAAKNRCHLRPLASTGKLLPSQPLTVGNVYHVGNKFDAVADFAAIQRKKYLFLASQEDKTPLSSPYVDVVRCTRLNDLLEHPDLLTDGFDGYRDRLANAACWDSLVPPGAGNSEALDEQFGQYLPEDERYLRELVQEGIVMDCRGAIFFATESTSDGQSEPGQSSKTCQRVDSVPFDNDPAVAAKFVCRLIAERILDHADRTGEASFPVEFPVPVWLPLSDLDEMDVHDLKTRRPSVYIEQQITKALEQIERELAGNAGDGDANVEELVDREVLRNTVRFDRDKLLLIAHSDPSRQHVYE